MNKTLSKVTQLSYWTDVITNCSTFKSSHVNDLISF